MFLLIIYQYTSEVSRKKKWVSSEPAVLQINQQDNSLAVWRPSPRLSFFYLASCVCFPLQFVWHASNVPLSTQQNSLRLCCSCFHRNVISSLQPGQSVSLAMVARQYLCPFSLLHCSCGELRPERENVWEVWSKVQEKLTLGANQSLKQQTHNGALDRRHFLGRVTSTFYKFNSLCFILSNIQQDTDTVD